jgi:HTH-type transcriptional regulator / antitoxin HigA
MASEALIPREKWTNAKVRMTHASEDAIALAVDVGVHPALIAGRLRHERKNFRLLTHLIGKSGQVRNYFGQ